MIWFAAALVVCVTAPVVQGSKAASSFAWCYHDPSCDDDTWPIQVPLHCNSSRQSPINIVSADAALDASLTAFNFTNFDSKSALTKIENTGRTIKVSFASGVSVSGGGLSEPYDSLQFHLHWGNGASIPGSEHTVDGKRYPMELHIVSAQSSHNLNTSTAVTDSTGLAALGFFIDVSDNTTGEPAAWKTLTSYLSSITTSGQSATISAGISLDDLLAGVDRTRYYRYLGSLTTPDCHEAVVWTVFKEPVKVSKDLIDLFSTTVRIGDSSSELMINVYRKIMPSQPVTQSSGSKTGYSVGMLIFILALWMT